MPKSFLAINFGCRVNAAELNQLSQSYLNQGFAPFLEGGLQGVSPSVIIINTCSVTKKGDIESLSRIRMLSKKYPEAQIIATGCARLEKVKDLPHLTILKNNDKNLLSSSYTPQIKDKFSNTHRYLLKVQSGCTQMCSYCIVPYRRNSLWSLPIEKAVATVNQSVANGYQEVIITGVNLEQYQPGLSNLLEALLTQTAIPLISFGSVPLNCIDDKFLSLIENSSLRISNFLHIPLQSGSDKILKLMRRPYNKQKIIEIFNKLKKFSLVKGRDGEAERDLSFGTDIIIGFPGETEADFQETLDLCQEIAFTKIHAFKFSPRPGTVARILWSQSEKISPAILKKRSQQIFSSQK